jgi:hypothetical protein
LDPDSLDRVDRILLAACAAIWLVALGAGVAATMALVDMGRGGHPESSGQSSTPWLLYTVIGISAAVIIGAVPLLLRARRNAMADSPPPARPTVRPAPAPQRPQVPGTEAPTTKLRTLGTVAEPVNPRPGYPAARATLTPTTPSPLATAVDQLWLRCGVVLACAMGIAMVAIGVATYLMAVESNAAAWVFYVLTGLVTLGMPAIPWFYLRELRALLEARAA